MVITGGADSCNQCSARNVQVAVVTEDGNAFDGPDQNSRSIIGGPGVRRELASRLAVSGQVSGIELGLGIRSRRDERGGVSAFAIRGGAIKEVLAEGTIIAEEGNARQAGLFHLVDDHDRFSGVTAVEERLGFLGGNVGQRSAVVGLAGSDGLKGDHGATQCFKLVIDNLGKTLAICLTIVHDCQILDIQLIVEIRSRKFSLGGIREDVAVEDLGTGLWSEAGLVAEGDIIGMPAAS